MSKLQIGSITLIVNGYTLNNGLPYFQRAVPKRLQSRLGKKTIKIRLLPEHGNFAVQCHRLTERYSALFRAMDSDPRLTPSEVKLKLTHFRGHLTVPERGVRSAQIQTAVPGGIPSTNH